MYFKFWKAIPLFLLYEIISRIYSIFVYLLKFIKIIAAVRTGLIKLFFLKINKNICFVSYKRFKQPEILFPEHPAQDIDINMD